MPNPPDSVLITRFQLGDSGVFDQLYLRHYSRIHGVILAIVSHPDDALDLTQEVFLKAYQRLHTFKHASGFYSWLYRIAINQCIDFMRRQSARRTTCHEPFSDDMFCHAPVPPLASLERAEFHRQLNVALPGQAPAGRHPCEHSSGVPFQQIL